jgi:TonB-linked SusC/RagA family outer membrane protein
MKKWVSKSNIRLWFGFGFFLLCFVVQIKSSQAQSITVDFNKAPLINVLKEIQKQTPYTFVYNNSLIDVNKLVSIKTEGENIVSFMNNLLKGTDITFKIVEKQITLSPKEFKDVPEGSPAVGNSKQEIKVLKGVIFDESKKPFPGVSVQNLSAKTGTFSNEKGEYSIKVKTGDKLLFSSIGMLPKQVTVTDDMKVLNVEMQLDNITLKDIVVTGYQTLPRERVTGSFTKIGREELRKVGSNLSLKDRLEDLVPGLYFEPHYDDEQNAPAGDSRSIVIRGMSTFGDNNPLIVVDGFPLDPDVSDPWTTINPDDVESVTVLKDAAAASIWGAQAANGVIVIETKKGDVSVTKPVFNISVDYMLKSKPNLDKIPWANSKDAVDIYKLMILDNTWLNSLTTTYYGTYELPEVMKVLVDMKRGDISESVGNSRLEELSQLDVRDEFSDLFLQTETAKKINLSMQVGGTTHRARASFTTTLNNGYSIGNTDNNFLANINEEFSPVKWLRVSAGVNLMFSKKESNGADIKELTYIPQHSRILDSNGDYLPMIKEEGNDNFYSFPTEQRRQYVEQYNLPYNWDWNLKQDVENRDNYVESTNLRVNSKVIITPVKPLSLELSYQYTRVHDLDHKYYNEKSWTVRNGVDYNATPDGTFQIPLGGMLAETKSNSFSHDARFQMVFNKQFGFHQIKALGGTEWKQDYYESIPYGFYGYDPQTLSYINALDYTANIRVKINGKTARPLTIPIIPGTSSYPGLYGKDNRFVSYYGNVGYTFKDKYDFTSSIRLDKTNLYGQAPSYRDLPQWSVGLGWTVSQESFMGNVKFLDYLRVRGSYGFNGLIDKTVSPFLYGYSATNLANQLPYLAVQSAPNPDLTWERTRVINFGLDASLFKDRMSVNLEIYSKYSSDVLVQTAVNGTYGFQNNRATVNAGNIKNTGVELNIQGAIVKNKDFNWRADLNISSNRNRTFGYHKVASNWTYYLSSPSYYHIEGQPVSYLAAMRWAGYDENGMPQFYYGKNTVYSVTNAPAYATLNPDSLLVFVGQKDPKLFGSFANSFTYKNFELNIRLQYKFGGKFFPDYPPDNMTYTWLRYNKYYTWLPEILVNRWKSPEDAETASMYALTYNSTSNVYNLLNRIERYNDNKVLSASQIRLQSINITYRLPFSLSKWVRNALVQVEARDLGPIWVANKKGIDPSNPPYGNAFYNSITYVTRYRPEYSIALRLEF